MHRSGFYMMNMKMLMASPAPGVWWLSTDPNNLGNRSRWLGTTVLAAQHCIQYSSEDEWKRKYVSSLSLRMCQVPYEIKKESQGKRGRSIQ